MYFVLDENIVEIWKFCTHIQAGVHKITRAWPDIDHFDGKQQRLFLILCLCITFFVLLLSVFFLFFFCSFLCFCFVLFYLFCSSTVFFSWLSNERCLIWYWLPSTCLISISLDQPIFAHKCTRDLSREREGEGGAIIDRDRNRQQEWMSDRRVYYNYCQYNVLLWFASNARSESVRATSSPVYVTT